MDRDRDRDRDPVNSTKRVNFNVVETGHNALTTRRTFLIFLYLPRTAFSVSFFFPQGESLRCQEILLLANIKIMRLYHAALLSRRQLLLKKDKGDRNSSQTGS